MKSGFFYVYILQSECDPPHFYTGFTENLEIRLAHHNSGGDPHTTKYRPWHIKTAIAFTEREEALAFERYLKSPSASTVWELVCCISFQSRERAAEFEKYLKVGSGHAFVHVGLCVGLC